MYHIGQWPNKLYLNRQLTEEEYREQLKPFSYDQLVDNSHNRFWSRTNEFLTTIKMNSSYLEVVDRFHATRGSLTHEGLLFLGLGLFTTIIMVSALVDKWPVSNEALFYWVILTTGMLGMFYGFAYALFRNELFALTHNPIRFDRRNRMVYAFLCNKEMVSAPWDDIFFCVVQSNNGLGSVVADIYGHILDDDGVTVLATFALGHRAWNPDSLRSYWNFINHYMEKGPEGLVGQVKYYLPIADRKEPLVWALNSLISMLGPLGFFSFFPLMMINLGARCLVTATSKIPVWPDWVEEKCQIEPDDPFIRDASMNPPVHAFSNLEKAQEIVAMAADAAKIAAAKSPAVVMQGISRQEKNKIARRNKIEIAKRPKKGSTQKTAIKAATGQSAVVKTVTDNPMNVHLRNDENLNTGKMSILKVIGIIFGVIFGIIFTAYFLIAIYYIKM